MARLQKPLAIDLYAGLGGWCEGLQAVGYRVVGFDIERHRYAKVTRPETSLKLEGNNGGKGRKIWTERPIARLKDAINGAEYTNEFMEYPGQLVLQNVLMLHGSQFKDAALIVARPPCQFFSYTAMPWQRAKKLAEDTRADPLVLEKELSLFNACFRIQREACEAAGRHIPLVVENVCGAQKWVGRAKWHYGSFYLWGDVPALMPSAAAIKAGHPERSYRHGHVSTAHLTNQAEHGLKFGGGWWHDSTNNLIRKHGSRSSARKAASAMIAKIPKPLAEWIGRVYYPEEKVA